MNKVILKGRLTSDPEIRYSQGTDPVAVAKFCIAAARGYKKDNENVTDFINCTTFGKTAEFMRKYFKKGQEILAEGQLHIDTYEYKGEKKKSFCVAVANVEFCGGKGDERGEVNPINGGYNAADITEEDDLPF